MQNPQPRAAESTPLVCDGARQRHAPHARGGVTQRYRIERLVAWGGMGLVYEATHLMLDVPVALKVLRPELGDCEEWVEAFLEEAHCLAALSSDHIVRVMDAGRLDTGLPFLAMERLVGRDLRCVMDACGPMSPAVAVQYALQACDALSEVHENGLIHCDVKPANLFVSIARDGSTRLKLLDFGIARASGRAAGPVSSLERGACSPLYASPEQLEAPADLDCRTDIWSLGLVLFEMLTGACPFAAATLADTQRRIRSERTAGIREVRPEIDERLAHAVDTCLQKDRARRFSSVDELADALRSAAPRHFRAQ